MGYVYGQRDTRSYVAPAADLRFNFVFSCFFFQPVSRNKNASTVFCCCRVASLMVSFS